MGAMVPENSAKIVVDFPHRGDACVLKFSLHFSLQRRSLAMTGPGRPTLYKPEYAERARQLCKLGATNRMLAEHFDVARSTIDQWLATVPEFTSAVWEGREHADLAVVDGLFTRATGYTRKAEKVV